MTRFWELGLGIVFAFLETIRIIDSRRINQGIRTAISVIGFFMICGAIFFYNPNIPVPGWFCQEAFKNSTDKASDVSTGGILK